MNSESKKWPQFLVVITATIAVFTTGLHTGWPAPSLPKLLSDEYPFDVTNEEASYITIIGSLGNFFGSFVGNIFLDKIGRRKTILMIALPQLVSLLCIILSYQVMELLYVGRFMGGIGEGMTITVILLYIGEIAEPTIRGTLATLVSITWYSGVLFVNIVGSYLSIRDTAITFIALPVLFVLLFYKMPESPYYLLMNNDEEQAERALKFLRRQSDVTQELTKLKLDVNRQMSERGTFKDIFTIDSNRRAFFVTVGARFFQLATGVASFNLYLQLLLKEATHTLDPDVGSTIVLLIQLIMTVCSTFIIDKWGRKPLLLFSSTGCFINLAVQSVFFILKERTAVDVSVVDWFPLVMMFLHIFLYSIGLGVVVSVLTSEMFSASIKAKLICLVNACYALLTLVYTKYYQFTADEFGLVVPFLSFAVLTFVGVLFIWFVVPETKGKSLEEIQQKLKGRGRRTENTVI
ncbi:hypothetical protein Zmor_017135 [Zophobas morio]|uniref:Major facilitator superfamily (MFS) profile domain-containing protein n=1 Tax=Zophobas morio TaxID=2755281 RepID=A0AA38IBW5_9CUCU|nr:hypothetical protein Zmor_017135 [Zophobas morio]